MGKSPRDRRRDGEPGNVAPELLVDRVFPAAREHKSAAKRPPTAAPETAPSSSAEVTLRHQVFRLQRELGEAQRKIADHDDEIAAERARCQTVTTAHHALVDEHAALERAVEAERAARLAAERELAELKLQSTRLGTENGLLGQRLSTAVKTVEVLAQEARALRERAVGAAASTPATSTKRANIDDDLDEEALKILYGDG